MARGKTGARKPTEINPAIESRPNGGDAHFLAGSPGALPVNEGAGGQGFVTSISLANATAYTQNFNSLANTGTSSALPTGWFIAESGTGSNATYTAGTGSGSTADTYSFGAAGDTERALGTLRSNALNLSFGTSFTNNIGATITSFLVSYKGEQWRRGDNTVADRLDFQYSLDATSITTGNWFSVDTLDFNSVTLTGGAGARDGNTIFSNVSGSIGSLMLASGATIWIRWVDFNVAGNDDGLAVDDFSITPTIAPPEPIIDLNGSGAGTGYASTYTEDVGGGGAGARIGAPDMTITDDLNTIDHVTLTIANGRNGDRIYIDSGSVPGWMQLDETGAYTWTLTSSFGGPWTPAEWAEALSHLRYFNVGVNPDSNGNRPVVTISVVASDGTNSSAAATASITVVPHNDEPDFLNYITGDVTEDLSTTFGGKLDVNDPDGPDTAVPMTDYAAAYGSFTIDAPGNWVYTLDNDHPTVASLSDGQTLIDTITVYATDDTPFDIVITIHGHTDNAPATVDLNGGAAGENYAATYITESAGVLIASAAASIEDDSDSIAIVRVRIADGQVGDNLYYLSGDFPAGLGIAWDPDTFTLEILAIGGSAARAEMAAALATIGFWNETPDPDNGGANPTRTIQVSAHDGNVYGPASVTLITLADTIDTPPVLDLNGGATAGIDFAASFAEGGDPVLLSAPSLIISDDQDHIVSASIIITNPEAGDDLIYGDLPPGITATFDAGGTVLFFDAPGGSVTAAEMAAALRTVGFWNEADEPVPGTRSILIVVNDGVTDSAHAFATVTVNAVNDAPVVTGLADDHVTGATGSLQLLDLGGDAVVTDVDSANFAGGSLTVSVVNGAQSGDAILFAMSAELLVDGNVIYVNGVRIGTYGAGPEPVSRSFSFEAGATPAAVQVLVRAVGLYHNGTTGGLRDIEWRLADGDGDATTFYSQITLQAPPAVTVDLDGGAAGYDYAGAFTENGAGVPIGSNIAIVAPGGTIAGAVIQLTDGSVGDQLTYDPLTIPGGLNVTASATQIQISGIATIAQYEAILAAIRYVNTSDNPTLNGNTDRVVSVYVSDHVSASNSPLAYATIAVTATNDTAIIGGNAAGEIYEDATASDNGLLTINDPDSGENRFQAYSASGNYGNFQVTESGFWQYFANDNQFMRGGHTYVDTFRVYSNDGQSHVDVVVTSYGNNDQAQIHIAGGNTVGYVYEDTPGGDTTDAFVAILDRDQGESGWVAGDFVTAYGTFHIETNGAWSYTLNNSAPALLGLDSGEHVTDTHLMTSLGGDQITLQVQVNGATDAPSAPPVLNTPIPDQMFDEDTAVSFQVPAGTFTDPDSALNYTATLADGSPLPLWLTFTAATQSFAGTPPANYHGTLSIRVTADDYQSQVSDEFDLVITSVLDAPTIDNLDGDTITIVEGAGETRLDLGQDALFGDVDNAHFDGGSLTISIDGRQPEEHISFALGGRIERIDADIRVDGLYIAQYSVGPAGQLVIGFYSSDATADRVQEVIRAITYFNANALSPVAGPREVNFAFEAADGTSTSATVMVEITQVNDAPSGTDTTRTILEDGSYHFSAVDFGFSDPAESDALLSVFIVTLPADGTLTLAGDPVVAGAEIAAADLASLVFTPAPNANGTLFFTFRVRDNGGTANGGSDTDAVAREFAFDVVAVNDAPVISGLDGDSVTYTEEDPAVLLDLGGDALVSDPDVSSNGVGGGTLTVAIGAGGVPSEDRLSIVEGNGVTLFGSNIRIDGSIYAGFSGGTNGTPLVITLNGDMTSERLERLLRQIGYDNSNAVDPSEAQRTITWTLNDGDGTADGGASTTSVTTYVNVVGTPEVTRAVDDVLNAVEDTPITFAAADLLGNDSGEDLEIVSVTAVSGGTVVLNGDGSVTFTPTPNFFGAAVFDYEVSGPLGTDTGRATVNVASVNDVPSLNGLAPSLTALENDGPILIDGDVILSDVEGNWDDGTIIVGGLLAEDVAGIRNQGTGAGQIGVSGSDVSYEGVVIGSFAGGSGASLVITLNGAATTIAVDALLQNLTYDNVSDTPTASRNLTISIVDGAGAAVAGAPLFTPISGAGTPLNGLDAGTYATPEFFDMDGDGDLDLIVGSNDTTIKAFRNDGGGSFVQVTGGANPFTGLSTGPASGVNSMGNMAFVDLDGDGDLDMVTGNGSGSLLSFRNNGVGNAFTALTGTDNPFNGLTTGIFSHPSFFDIDGDGDLDALVGQQPGAGGIRAFQNNGPGNAFTALSGAANPFNGINVGYRSNLTYMDLDGDGDLDVIAANFNSPLQAFRNNGPGAAFTAMTGAANPLAGINVGSMTSPDVADVDGDGDLDIVVGRADGTFLVLQNDGFAPPTISVNVTAQNDRPVIANGGSETTTYVENGAPVVIAPAFTVTDADSPSLQWLVVTIGGTSTVDDRLSFTNDNAALYGNISGTYDVGTRQILLTSAGNTATVAQFEAAARAIVFYNDSDTPVMGTRNLTILVRDSNGLNALASVLRPLVITPVNDAPSGGSRIITIDEDTPFVFTVADFGFSDPEGHAFVAVTITNPPTAAALTLDGVAVTHGQSISVADIIAGRLVLTPAPNAHGGGHAFLNFRVQDNGGTANGGVELDSSPNFFVFDVRAINDPPVADDTSAQAPEDWLFGTVTLAAADVDDPDGSGPPPSFTIDTLPPHLTLINQLGETIEAGVAYQADYYDSSEGRWVLVLNYLPDANWSGETGFDYVAADAAGAESAPATATVTVNAVADAPIVDPGVGGPPDATGPAINLTGTGGFEDSPSVVALPDGRSLVVWQAGFGSVRARYLDADGQPEGAAFDVSTPGGQAEVLPAVAAQPDGRFAIAWFEDGATLTTDMVRIAFYAAGATTPTTVTAYPPSEAYYEADPVLTAGPDGYMLTWAREGGGGAEIIAQYFGFDGQPSSLPQLIMSDAYAGTNSGQFFDPPNHRVAGIGDGRFVLVAEQANGDVVASIFTGLGLRDVLPVVGNGEGATVAALDGGNFVVVWSDAGELRTELFTSAGDSLGEVGFGSAGGGLFFAPEVAALPGGGFVLAWISNDGVAGSYDIFAQTYDAAGAPTGGPLNVTNTGLNGSGMPINEVQPTISVSSDGLVTIGWLQPFATGNPFDVFLRSFTVPPTGLHMNAGGHVLLPAVFGLADTDGSEILVQIRIGGMPEGFFFPLGYREYGEPDGDWIFDRSTPEMAALLDDLALGVTDILPLNAPAGYEGDPVLQIAATTREPSNGSQTTGAPVPLQLHVNLVPTAVDDTLTATEDQPKTFTAAELVGNDTDAPGATLTVASVTAISGGTVVLNPDGTITFTPDPNFSGPALFDYVVSDGKGGTDTGRATVNVAAVDDAPAIANLDGDIVTFVEDGPEVRLDLGQDALFIDPDTGNFGGATLVVSIDGRLPEEFLSFALGGRIQRVDAYILIDAQIVAEFSVGGDAQLSLVFTDQTTPDEIQTLLRAFTYVNANTLAPVESPREVVFTFTQSGGTPITATVTVNVETSSDAPAGTDRAISIQEDQSHVLTVADFGFLDLEGDAFAGVIVTEAPTGGTLTLDGVALTTFPSALVSAADIAAGKLVFVATPDFDGAGTVRFAVQDDGAPGANGDPSPNTLTIDILPVNDAPVLSGGNTATYVENSAPVVVNPNIVVTDIDDTSLVSATVAISDNWKGAQDRLAFDNDNAALYGDISATYNAASGTLSLSSASGTATLAQWQAALRAVTYENLSDAPDTAPRGIDFQVDDGDADSQYQFAEVNVASVNDAPVITGLDGDSATFVEGGGEVSIDVGMNADLSDVDSPDFAGGAMTVAVAGALPEEFISFTVGGRVQLVGPAVAVDGTTIAIFTGGGNGTLAFTFLAGATADRVEVLLHSLTYFNGNTADPVAGPREITVTLSDGDGGAGTVVATSIVNVIAVNDAPSGADAGATILEDSGAYVFGVADFPYSDPDGPGFGGVTFTSLPTGGTLYYDVDGPGGSDPIAFSPGSSFAASELAAGKIWYVPTADATGSHSFSFVVFESGGGLSDPTPNSFTFDITPVNDAPTVTIAPTGLVPSGDEQRVNTAAGGDQSAPGIATLAGGGYVVVYQGEGPGDTDGVFMRRYDSSGAAQGGEILINLVTAGAQDQPAVAALTGGGYVVVWAGADADGGGIFARRYDGNGVVLDAGEVQINNMTAGSQTLPSIAALGNGGYVVSWEAPDGNGTGIYARLYNANGSPATNEFLVNSVVANDQSDASVIGLPGGDFVVTWTSQAEDGDGNGIYARRFDPTGAPIGAAFRVSQTQVGDQFDSASATLTGGSFVIAWSSADGSDTGIFVRRYSSTGVALGGEAPVNTTVAGKQSDAQVTALADGGYLVTWTSDGQDGDGAGIYAQRYTAGGVPVDGEMLVNGTTEGGQQGAVATALGDGYVVAWSGNGDGDTAGIFTRQAAPGFAAVEGAAIDLKGTISVADVDAGSSILTVTLSVGYGRLDVAMGGSGASVTGGNGTSSVTVSGTLAQLEALLNTDGTSQVSFTADTDAPPAATTLTVTVDDGGATGSGGPLTGSASVAILITGVNDAPSGADKTIVMAEDGTYVLTVADFGFTDADGNALLEVVLSTTPTGGTLYLDPDGPGGTAPTILGATSIVSAAAIAAGQVYFVPTADANGAGLGGFQFQVRDNGGTAYGGSDIDITPNTLTFDVTAVNDAPTVTIVVPPVAQGEVRVNNAAGGGQSAPGIATLAGGGYVIVYQGEGPGDTDGVFMRRYDSSGAAQGGEILVNLVTAGVQGQPGVAALNGGDYVVVWAGTDASGAGIFARRYDGNGVALDAGDVQINNTTAGNQTLPSIAALGNGGYVVSWEAADGNGTGIYARLYNANGSPATNEFLVNSVVANDQSDASVIGLPGGNFVVTWTSQAQDGDGNGVYARRFDPTGAPIGSVFRVSGTQVGDQQDSAGAALTGGGFVIVWSSADGDDSGIFVQRYSSSGVALGGEAPVNTTVAGRQSDAQVTALADGGYLVTWTSAGQDGDGAGIYAQRYNAGGVPQGGEFLVNATTNGSQQGAAATALGDGYVLAWSGAGTGDGAGIFAQGFQPGYGAVEQIAASLKDTIAIDDPDAGSSILTVTLSVGYGRLDVAVGTSGANIVGGNGTDAVTVSGTLAQLNALLNSDATSLVTFTADTDAPPATATLNVIVDDGGATGAGGALTGSGSATIAIASVNDAPSGTDGSVSVSENDAYPFTQADFGFSDVAEGHGFFGVRITTL
ncbi:MAG TPA: tandem-95 repeat protein, partial [Allosphingosinicella sp.]|nr:tandem-95 repeat protein [Allosphingosinicella sp.]